MSRARVEDLMNILIIQLKKMLTDVADGLTIENIVFVGITHNSHEVKNYVIRWIFLRSSHSKCHQVAVWKC